MKDIPLIIGLMALVMGLMWYGDYQDKKEEEEEEEERNALKEKFQETFWDVKSLQEPLANTSLEAMARMRESGNSIWPKQVQPLIPLGQAQHDMTNVQPRYTTRPIEENMQVNMTSETALEEAVQNTNTEKFSADEYKLNKLIILVQFCMLSRRDIPVKDCLEIASRLFNDPTLTTPEFYSKFIGYYEQLGQTLQSKLSR